VFGFIPEYRSASLRKQRSASPESSGTYSATKFFVLTLTQAMDQELNSKGIQVQAVLQGATNTQVAQR
jgi:short-subunit dehydrogenase